MTDEEMKQLAKEWNPLEETLPHFVLRKLVLEPLAEELSKPGVIDELLKEHRTKEE